MPKETFRLHNVNNPEINPTEDIADSASIEELKAKRQAKKDASLYDEEGRVNDPEIAHEMAKTENPYRKEVQQRKKEDILPFIFKQRKKREMESRVQEGINYAESRGENLQTEKQEKKNKQEKYEQIKKILIEGLQKNTALQNALEKSKKNIEDLIKIDAHSGKVVVNSLYPLKNKNENIKILPVLTIFPIPDYHKYTSIVFLQSNITDGTKTYDENQNIEMQEDIDEWAQNFAMWGERKGLI